MTTRQHYQRISKNQKLVDLCLDYSATVTVPYDGMKGKRYKVYEIVGTRVTVKTNRLIDFHICEVILHPITYSDKEYNQLQTL